MIYMYLDHAYIVFKLLIITRMIYMYLSCRFMKNSLQGSCRSEKFRKCQEIKMMVSKNLGEAVKVKKSRR